MEQLQELPHWCSTVEIISVKGTLERPCQAALTDGDPEASASYLTVCHFASVTSTNPIILCNFYCAVTNIFPEITFVFCFQVNAWYKETKNN